MGLHGSVINSQRIIGGKGVSNSGSMRFKLNRIFTSIAIQRATLKETSSTPEGYRMQKAPLIFPLTNGGAAGRISKTFDVSANIMGDGYIVGDASVVFTVSGSGDLLASINGNATVTFTVLCDILGYGYMSGNADISAQPTAADIAGEFFATMVDGTFTMRDVLRILAAVAAGKTTIADLGGGAATVTFRDLSDTTDRVVADMTNSERTDVTIG